MKNLISKMMMSAACALLLATPNAWAEESGPVSISGYVGAVSQYVWRGVPQTGRLPSVQGDMSLSFSAVEGLSLGVWIASIGGATQNETDYYLTYEGKAGELGYSAGLTLYSYDYTSFTTIDKGNGPVNVATQKEIKLGVEYGDFSGTLYVVPAEDSTYGIGDVADESVSLNWIELAYSTELIGMGFGFNYGTGTYNQQWLNAGNAVESTGVLTVSMSKELESGVELSFNKTHVLGQSGTGTQLENEFWMSLQASY